MKDSFALLFAFIISLTIQGQNIKWPVLKHYDEHHISKVAMPVGGIGTGNRFHKRKGQPCGLGDYEPAWERFQHGNSRK
jgi:non-lysosomal glucosylceramidase